MRDRQLYERILGLPEPWLVRDVELNEKERQVIIHVGLGDEGLLHCPECDAAMAGYDHRTRSWRHLDTCQYQTILQAEVPRGTCDAHGVRQIHVPWAEPLSRFTALFERLAIDWLQEAGQKAVARRLGLSWDEVHGIMERAVARGLKRQEDTIVPFLGVDEKSFKKRHDYVTVVCDLEEGRVLDVQEGRKQKSLDAFYEGLTEAQLEGIEGVAMDMWEPYIQSTRDHVPDAAGKIVFDKFHIAKHLNEAVDKVRRGEHKVLQSQGDDSLKRTRFWWLKNPKNFARKIWRDFKELRESNLKTARAWALKETIMDLWDYTYPKSAKRFFRDWYAWAIRSRLEPIKEAARMIKSHLTNILTYLKHRITNAMSEGINSKIQWIKYTARGFRNRANFRTAILFHCGNLDLYPHETQ